MGSMAKSAKSFYTSVRVGGGDFCIVGFDRIGGRWVSCGRVGKILVRSSKPVPGGIDFLFNFAIEVKKKFELATHRASANFADAVAKPMNYADCATCRNALRCPIFQEFMDYIGNATMLRQIAY